MSLHKEYRVSCDGSDLLLRRAWRDHGTKTDPYAEADPDTRARIRLAIRDLHRACKGIGSSEATSAKARREARKAGWVRHYEALPIYTGTDVVSTTPFDLCSACRATLVGEPASAAI